MLPIHSAKFFTFCSTSSQTSFIGLCCEELVLNYLCFKLQPLVPVDMLTEAGHWQEDQE